MYSILDVFKHAQGHVNPFFSMPVKSSVHLKARTREDDKISAGCEIIRGILTTDPDK